MWALSLTQSIYQWRQPQNSQWWRIIADSGSGQHALVGDSISGQPECVCVCNEKWEMKSVCGQLEKKHTLSRHFWQTPFTLPWVYRFTHISLGWDAASFLHCCAHDPTPIYRWRMVSSRGGVINNCVDSSLYNTIWPLDFIFTTSSDAEETYIWAMKALCDPWPLLTFIRNMYCASWNNIQTWNLIIVLQPPFSCPFEFDGFGRVLKCQQQKNVMPLSKSIHCNLQ